MHQEKPVRTHSSHPTHHPRSPPPLSPEPHAPQLFKQQPGQGQHCEMVTTFVERDSQPHIRSGPCISTYDGIQQPARHVLRQETGKSRWRQGECVP